MYNLWKPWVCKNCIDQLEAIRGDLVRTDDDLRQWDFVKLLDAVRKCTERNPIKPSEKPAKFTMEFTTRENLSNTTTRSETKKVCLL